MPSSSVPSSPSSEAGTSKRHHCPPAYKSPIGIHAVVPLAKPLFGFCRFSPQ